MTLKDYIIGTIIRPGATFNALAVDNKNTKYTFRLVLTFLILNSVLNIGFILGGKLPTMPMIVKLPDEYYFHWCLFVANFAIICCYFMTAALIYFASRRFKAGGSIEGALSAVCFAYSVPFFFYLIADYAVLIAISITGAAKPEGMWNTLLMGTSMAVLIWHFILLPKAVKSLGGIKWGPAILIGTITNIIFWGFAFIFLM